HEVVGTGGFMRALESRVGWLRHRVRSLVTGAPGGDAELKAAVRTGVDAVVASAADRAAERAAGAWRGPPAGRAPLGGQARVAAGRPARARSRAARRGGRALRPPARSGRAGPGGARTRGGRPPSLRARAVSAPLDRRLTALAEAVELAGGRLDPDRVEAARAV